MIPVGPNRARKRPNVVETSVSEKSERQRHKFVRAVVRRSASKNTTTEREDWTNKSHRRLQKLSAEIAIDERTTASSHGTALLLGREADGPVRIDDKSSSSSRARPAAPVASTQAASRWTAGDFVRRRPDDDAHVRRAPSPSSVSLCVGASSNRQDESPSEGQSLNRSQRGNCSTEYNTPPGTQVVYRQFRVPTSNRVIPVIDR